MRFVGSAGTGDRSIGLTGSAGAMFSARARTGATGAAGGGSAGGTAATGPDGRAGRLASGGRALATGDTAAVAGRESRAGAVTLTAFGHTT
jgi:hypothetical protein